MSAAETYAEYTMYKPEPTRKIVAMKIMVQAQLDALLCPLCSGELTFEKRDALVRPMTPDLTRGDDCGFFYMSEIGTDGSIRYIYTAK